MPASEETSGCPLCGYEQCDCYTCERCEQLCNPEDSNPCSLCGRCGRCCEEVGDCYTCVSCSQTISSSRGQCSECGDCPNCCDCVTCRSCDSVYRASRTDFCSNCDYCDDCCECSTCEECGERGADLECDDCGHCTSCGCSCLEETEAEEDENEEHCSTCDNRLSRCRCFLCHSIDSETGLITSTHQFIEGENAPRCVNCLSCSEHCTATTCISCGTKQHKYCDYCGKCSACCPCPKCMRGESVPIGVTVCPRCLCCDEHCSCPRCQTCGSKIDRSCPHCHNCKACCLGEASPCGAFSRKNAIPDRDNPFTKHIPSRKNLQTMRNPRLIGLEIEVNNVGSLDKSRILHEALDEWNDSVVPDGSIGGQPTAFEINVTPSGGDLFLNHVKQLCDGLALIKANPNQKCGLHTHIDCSDFTMYDLRRLIQLYVKCERALFDLCHPYRLNYTYARVCGKLLSSAGLPIDPRMFRQELNKRLYGEIQDNLLLPDGELLRIHYGTDASYLSPKEKLPRLHALRKELGKGLKASKSVKGNAHRYNAFNVHSFFMRKTIEFRHHEGTVDYATIVGWASVLQEFVTSAERMTNQEVSDLPRNSKKALLAVLPEKLRTWVIQTWDTNNKLRKESSAFIATYQSFWGKSGDS